MIVRASTWATMARQAASRTMRQILDAARQGEHGAIAYEQLSLDFSGKREERTDAATAGPFIERYWAELLAAAIAGAVMLYVVFLFTRYALPPSGDSGQWLAVSRFYLMEHVPADRSVATLPPIVPVLLAGFSLVVGKPGAIVVFAALSYGALCGTSFALGRRLTGAASGGLLAVVAVAAVQPQLFEMFAVGAYPQIAATVGMALCLYALIGLTEEPESRRHWLHLAGGTALTVFSHTPSATVLLPALATSLAYVAWSSPRPRVTLREGARALGPVLGLWAVFLFINRDVVFDYASVPAAYDLKGPERLISNIWRDNVQRTVFLAGLAMLSALPFVEPGARGLRGKRSMVLATWTGTILALIAFAAVRHTGTDYPRFAAYFIVPLGVATAAGVHAFSLPRSAMIALVAPALLFAGHDGLRYLDDASRFYGLNERSDDLRDTSAWLNERDDDGGVIAGTRETKWLQALTGRDSLLYLPRVAITRPWEVERALGADVLFRSSGGIESGRLFVTVNDGGEDFGKIHAVGVRVDTFDRGIYEQTLQIKDQQTILSFETYGAVQRVRLSSMLARPSTVYHDDAGEHLMTIFDGANGLPVQVIRVVTVDDRDLNIVRADYYVGLPDGVRPRSLVIGTGASDPITIEGGGEMWMFAEMKDGDIVPMSALTSWVGNIDRPAEGNGLLTWRRASAVIDVGDGDQRIPYTRTYDPAQILRDDGIRYIIDRDGDGASFPIIRQRGLQPVYQNEEYRVYEAP